MHAPNNAAVADDHREHRDAIHYEVHQVVPGFDRVISLHKVAAIVELMNEKTHGDIIVMIVQRVAAREERGYAHSSANGKQADDHQLRALR